VARQFHADGNFTGASSFTMPGVAGCHPSRGCQICRRWRLRSGTEATTGIRLPVLTLNSADRSIPLAAQAPSRRCRCIRRRA
jgi:hypothetical protein